MTLSKWFLSAAVAVGLTLGGCASTPTQPEKPQLDLPSWVLNPSVEDGVATAECVKWSGNMGLDKAEAEAKARANLAKQLEVKVQAMDKAYARKVQAGGETNVGSTFETVSKQLAEQTLSGARILKMDVVPIQGEQYLCAQMAMGVSAKKFVDQLVNESGREVDAQDEKFLYEEFKAHKAQQALEQEMANM